MDSRLVCGMGQIGAYLIVGKCAWNDRPEIVSGRISKDGPYLTGDRVGQVLAIQEEAEPDENGYYPCVLLEVQTDWRNNYERPAEEFGDDDEDDDWNGDFNWCNVSLRDIAVRSEIKLPFDCGDQITIAHNPRNPSEVSVRGDVSAATLREVELLVCKFELRLEEDLRQRI